jgi:hypothetical protein
MLPHSVTKENSVSKKKEIQRIIRAYRDETGERELDMRRIAKWAVSKGMKLPTPPDPIDILTRQFSEAAREQIEYDSKTKKPYRRYHAIKTSHGGTQLHLFVDIEEATRPQMLVSLVMRREQMVSDGLLLSYDQDHWNSIHPEEEQISLPMDLTFDIELRRNAPDEEEGAA